MLRLKNIKKTYTTSNFHQKALDGISLSFRSSEFVSILGPSGSGKTTMLNIIGGLDKYTSGDLIINGISTKKFNDRDWDTYRNHHIGFVFQNYNLISHQTILSNVELSLTLSGVSKNERKQSAIDALTKVGLKDHLYKKPNQLSGGQMQRVAIARALINDPDILLADEPTGALDSETSKQIMDLLKEVAKEKLVIMVTHNAEVAKEYSTRIIEIKDGKIISDSDEYVIEGETNPKFDSKKKTSMSFMTALSLSFNNLLTKKARTILTSFAGSIGIIGIALILSLSNGVQNYINRVQEETLTSYPITIQSSTLDFTSMMMDVQNEDDIVREPNKIYSNDTIVKTLELMSSKVESNNLKKFKNYIEENSEVFSKYSSAISYDYDLKLQIYKNDSDNKIVQVSPETVLENLGFGNTQNTGTTMMMGSVWNKLLDNDVMNKSMYEIVAGRMPSKYNEIVIMVDKENEITDYILYAIGLKDQTELKKMYEKVIKGETVTSESTSYTYDEILGLKFRFLLNSDYFEKQGKIWVNKKADEKYLKNKLASAEEIEVVGIIKPSDESTVSSNAMGGIYYLKDLEEFVINKINEAPIVKEQKMNPEINVLTGTKFSDGEDFTLTFEQQQYLSTLSPQELAKLMAEYQKQASLNYDDVLLELGSVDLEEPSSINIYAKDFESKDEIKNIIEAYNKKEEASGNEENVINYTDMVGLLMSSVTNIVNIISYVLIGFVSISLVVSSIMIGIITYISVLERTKEIGILRAVGASKKDVSRVFTAETLIIGLISGIIGICVTLAINLPINLVVKSLANVSNLAKLPIAGAIILILISVILTLIAGLIPSRIASKKDPVESLRCE